MRHLLATALLLPLPALAEPVLDLRIDGSVPTSEGASALGTGVGGRVGLPLDAKLVRLVPEAGLTLWTAKGLLVPDLGLRASVGAGIEPGAYGHLMFPLPTPGGPTRGWDAGARVDFTMLPIDIGVHAGLMGFTGPASDPARYLTAGLDLGLSF